MPEKSYEKRRKMIFKLIEDRVVDLAFQESLNLIYHWWRFEMLLIKRDNVQKKLEKHSQKINNVVDIANFKHQLQDL